MRRSSWNRPLGKAVLAGKLGGSPPQSQYEKANKITITPATVGQFITGLKAELAERDRLAAAAQTDANVKTFWQRRDRHVGCDSLKQWQDAEEQRVTKAMQTAATEAQMNAAVA